MAMLTDVPAHLQESLRKTMEILRAVDTAGEDRFIFGSWQPESVSRDDPFYKRPVAFDTVTGYLLAPKLPARILVHGSSGNGKTSLMRQLLAAIRNEVCSSCTQPSQAYSKRD